MTQPSVFLTYHDLMMQLIELCRHQATGTVFICTKRNQAISFILREGEIIGCCFEHKRGLEALNQIKKITAGTYTFCQNVFFSYQMDETHQLSLKEFFNHLKIEYSEREKPSKLYRGASIMADEKKPLAGKNVRIYRGVVISDDNEPADCTDSSSKDKDLSRRYRGQKV